MAENLIKQWDELIEPQLEFVAESVHGRPHAAPRPPLSKPQMWWTMRITKLCNPDRAAWEEAFRRLAETVLGYGIEHWLRPLSEGPQFNVKRRFDRPSDDPVLFESVGEEAAVQISRHILAEMPPLLSFARFCRQAFATVDNTAPKYKKLTVSALFVRMLTFQVARPLKDVLANVVRRGLSQHRDAMIRDGEPTDIRFTADELTTLAKFAVWPEATILGVGERRANLYELRSEPYQQMKERGWKLTIVLSKDLAAALQNAMPQWMADETANPWEIPSKFFRVADQTEQLVASLGDPIVGAEYHDYLVQAVVSTALYPHAEALLHRPAALPTILAPRGSLSLSDDEKSHLAILVKRLRLTEACNVAAPVLGKYFDRFVADGFRALRSSVNDALRAGESHNTVITRYTERLIDSVAALDELFQSPAGPLAGSAFCRDIAKHQIHEELRAPLAGTLDTGAVLARYVDTLMRNRTVSDFDRQKRLATFRRLLSLLPSKDIFHEEYRIRLIGRILGAADATNSTSSELEVIELLQQEVVGLRSFGKMVSDLHSAGALHEFEDPSGTGLRVTLRILTRSRWPCFPPATFTVPMAVAGFLRRIEQQFQSNRKRLQWVTVGQATMSIAFSKGPREINVPLNVAALLYQMGRCHHANITELLSLTGMAAPEAQQALLCCAQLPNLLTIRHIATESDASDFSAAIAPALASPARYTITINVEGFSHKLRRIELKRLVSGPDTNATPSAVVLRRPLAVEACIVRVMKSRSLLNVSTLEAEVLRLLAPSTFECSRAMVKDAINTLIEREYLSRDAETDADFMIKYIA